jgi:hypothetical protein
MAQLRIWRRLRTRHSSNSKLQREEPPKRNAEEKRQGEERKRRKSRDKRLRRLEVLPAGQEPGGVALLEAVHSAGQPQPPRPITRRQVSRAQGASRALDVGLAVQGRGGQEVPSNLDNIMGFQIYRARLER